MRRCRKPQRTQPRQVHLKLTFRSLQGKLYVRGDSKIFRFQNGKSESLFHQRKNPRRISWTVLFRRQHRKGISEVRTSLNTTDANLDIALTTL